LFGGALGHEQNYNDEYKEVIRPRTVSIWRPCAVVPRVRLASERPVVDGKPKTRGGSVLIPLNAQLQIAPGKWAFQIKKTTVYV
jgi:hypothetical protein